MENKNGCSYGKVNRNMIENLSTGFKDFRVDMQNEFNDMKKLNTELFNHLSSRLPPWATALGAIGIAVFSAVIGILIGGKV